mgnify:CR=1 FL=1
MKQSFCNVSGTEKKNSIDEAIRNLYGRILSTVLYHMAGNSLPKEDIERNCGRCVCCTLEEYREDRFAERYITVISCCCCPKFCSETDKQKKRIIQFLKILNCQMDKDFIEENFHNNYVWETVMSLGEPDSEIFVRRYKFDEKSRTFQKQWDLIFLQLRPDFQEEKENSEKCY